MYFLGIRFGGAGVREERPSSRAGEIDTRIYMLYLVRDEGGAYAQIDRGCGSLSLSLALSLSLSLVWPRRANDLRSFLANGTHEKSAAYILTLKPLRSGSLKALVLSTPCCSAGRATPIPTEITSALARAKHTERIASRLLLFLCTSLA